MTVPGFRLPARSFAFLLAAVAAGSVFAIPARAWWNGQWPMRKKITLDLSAAGASISDPVGTVVMLVRLHDANFQFNAAKPDGSDLRFVAADDKTLLPYHIEKFDSLLDEAFVWVQVPDLKPGEVRNLWLYYGNSGASSAEDTRATYDAQTVLVYHFSEHGRPARDSSPAGNDARDAGTPADGAIIGTGLRLGGHGSLNLPGTPSLTWSDGGAMTWSAWIKPVALASNAVIFSRREEQRAFVIGLDRGIPFVEVKDASRTHRSPAGSPIPAGQWHHWSAVATGTELTLYLDGKSYAEFSARLPALGTAAILGVDTAAGPTERAAESEFSGDIDEMELSRTARPPGFIAFAAVNQGGDQTKVLAMGADEQRATWLSWLKSGYFGIILNSLTLDGWVVIGLLFVMAAISWSVMVRKAVYLSSIGRGNTLFLREWQRLSADLTALDHGEADKVETMGGQIDPAGQRALHAAPIYRIYHVGAEEIRRRLAGGKFDGPKSLSSRSLQAIRASLDGALVRESQQLNSQMVLLTIAISGGPFLGLLGTVVGVMITFAAIAAAGDVNVNAIAPGIAAALVATVAGLAVAIPSLFGYNYLLSRVKDAISDMHVFIDEFVSRMAEFYPEPPR